MNAKLLVVGVAMLGFNGSALGVDQELPAAKANPAAVAQWRKTLLEWREQYFTGEGENPRALWNQGREKIAAIEDQAAIPAIVALLRTEKHPQFRRAMIVPLISMGGKEAVACLVKWSVEDENPLLREEAAKGLVGKQELQVHLDTYITYLKSPKYVASAAEALTWTRLSQPISTVERPDEKLTKALINALHTDQIKIVPYSVTFDSGERAHMTRMNNIGPWRQRGTDEGMVRVRIPVAQPKVVAALEEYSGQHYQYDEKSWLVWLEKRLKP